MKTNAAANICRFSLGPRCSCLSPWLPSTLWAPSSLLRRKWFCSWVSLPFPGKGVLSISILASGPQPKMKLPHTLTHPCGHPTPPTLSLPMVSGPIALHTQWSRFAFISLSLSFLMNKEDDKYPNPKHRELWNSCVFSSGHQMVLTSLQDGFLGRHKGTTTSGLLQI